MGTPPYSVLYGFSRRQPTTGTRTIPADKGVEEAFKEVERSRINVSPLEPCSSCISGSVVKRGFWHDTVHRLQTAHVHVSCSRRTVHAWAPLSCSESMVADLLNASLVVMSSTFRARVDLS